MAETQKKSGEPAQQPAPYYSNPLSDFRSQMDRLFDDFFSGWRTPRMGGMLDLARSPLGDMVSPRIEVAETDNAIEVTAELPGLSEKEIDVSLDDGVLTIKGEKRAEKEEKKKNYYLSERHYGAFHRAFRLPENADEQDIKARFDKGVLTISVGKKAEPAKPSGRKIPIGK